MVNNATNINKQWWSTMPPISTNWWSTMPPISTNRDSQQCHQYHQTVMVNNATNINKQWWSTMPPISTNSDGQQCHQNQQTVMVNNATNINKPNNHLSPEIIEQNKKTTTYDVENPGHCLEQAPNVTGLIWDPPQMLLVLCMLWYYLLDCTM